MTKVGAYIVLRLWLLLFGEGAGASAQFGGEWLLFGGMVTVAFGVIGTLASQDMARLAAFSVLVSSGTVLAAIGMGQVGVTGGALFYLVSSTLGLGAFFLLIELVERGREPGADVLAVTREAYGEDDDDFDEEEEVGIAIPATMAMLGLAFIGCALVIAGLPPLSGFIAKFALLTAALNPPGMTPRRRPDPGRVMGVARRADPVRIGSAHRDDPRGHPRLLGGARPHRAARARDRDGAGRRASHPMRDSDDPGRTDHALHAGHGPVASRAAGLHRATCCAPPSESSAQGGRHMTRLLPFPLVSRRPAGRCGCCSTRRFRLGHVLLGGVVALVGGWALTALQPPKARVRRPGAILRLSSLVLADIVRSNIAVARIISVSGRRKRTSGFVNIPLELRDPYGLAVLACIITSTPGTFWVELRSGERDIDDPRPRSDRRERVDPDDQGSLRAAVAGDLRMSAAC